MTERSHLAHNADLWLEALGALSAAALLPFYMGYLHLTVMDLILYSAVAGATLALGEQLRFPGLQQASLKDLLDDLLLWAQLVLGAGFVCYLLALLLV